MLKKIGIDFVQGNFIAYPTAQLNS
jgi:EAL domain-containing protein (putative c-di-GMP-specific phosphodiesterase class I)